MKRIGIIISMFLAFVSHATVFAGEGSLLDSVKKAGVVRIGTGTTAPPMNYLDENGVWTGFDVDLGDALAAKLGVKVERINVNTKTRVAFLAAGRIDMTISSMNHTRSRDEQIDFAEPPYLWIGKVFYAKKGKFKSIAELGGKRIAVQQGSSGYLAAPQEIARHTNKEPIMVSFQTDAECFLALKQDKVDAFTEDTTIVAGVAGNEGVEYEAVERLYSATLYGIGVPQDDSRWRDAISFALQDLIKDGTYEKIYLKWFGEHGKYPMRSDARPRLPSEVFGDRNAFIWAD